MKKELEDKEPAPEGKGLLGGDSNIDSSFNKNSDANSSFNLSNVFGGGKK